MDSGIFQYLTLFWSEELLKPHTKTDDSCLFLPSNFLTLLSFFFLFFFFFFATFKFKRRRLADFPHIISIYGFFYWNNIYRTFFTYQDCKKKLFHFHILRFSQNPNPTKILKLDLKLIKVRFGARNKHKQRNALLFTFFPLLFLKNQGLCFSYFLVKSARALRICPERCGASTILQEIHCSLGHLLQQMLQASMRSLVAFS